LLAEDDHAVGDSDIQPIARLDPEVAARHAGDDDLVLGTYLDA
jgi:hypothetical protein